MVSSMGPAASMGAPAAQSSPIGSLDATSQFSQMKLYRTGGIPTPPPASVSNHMVVDDGNASPNIMKMSLYSLPVSNDILKQTGLILGGVLSPLAPIGLGDQQVPVVSSPELPIRCSRCYAYVSSATKFLNGGRQYQCAICGLVSEVPNEYYAPLDYTTGRRSDIQSRPELRFGSVEYPAPKEMILKPLQPESILFCVDVSGLAMSMGILGEMILMLKHMLQNQLIRSPTRIGIMAYDTRMHFFNLHPNLNKPQIMVVSTPEDPFVPLVDGLFVTYEESKDVIDALLDSLPTIFQSNVGSTAHLGAALNVALEAFKETGGRAIVLHTQINNQGFDMVKPRLEDGIRGTDKEFKCYRPASNDVYYKKLAKALVDAAVRIDLFIFGANIDVATIGEVSRLTGGDLNVYPYLREQPTQVQQFRGDLLRNITRVNGVDGRLRIRCSSGLKIAAVTGHCSVSGDDIILAGLDGDKALGFELGYDGKLTNDSNSVIQAALLYTNAAGQRRLRVHTIALPATPQTAGVFQMADLDTLVNLMVRRAVQMLRKPGSSLKAVQGLLSSQAAAIIKSYRVKGSSNAAASQNFVITENLKLLPLYVDAALKSALCRPESAISLPMRVAAMYHFESVSIQAGSLFLYPRMFSLNPLGPTHGTHSRNGPLIRLPAAVRLSRQSLSEAGAYVLDNGVVMVLWVGCQVDDEFASELFGEPVNASTNRLLLTRRENDLSVRIHAILDHCRRVSGQAVVVMRSADKHEMHGELLASMVEDSSPSRPSFPDFLIALHREVMKGISN